MWFWECPKRDCPFSVVDESEQAVGKAAQEHVKLPGHEQWRHSIRHEFEEDPADYSMCVCGVPATEHWRVEPLR